MPDRRLSAVVIGLALSAGLLTACGDGGESAAPTPSSVPATSTSTTAASTTESATTSAAPTSKRTTSRTTTMDTASEVPDSDAPRPSATETEDPADATTDLPAETAPQTVTEPVGAQRKTFLDKVHKTGLTIDDEFAVSLGVSVCDVRKNSGQATAEQYATSVLKAAQDQPPSQADVRTFVNASRGLC